MTSMRSFRHSLFQRQLGRLVLSLILATVLARAQTPMKKHLAATTKSSSVQPTVAEAKRFIEQVETRMLDLWIKSGRASWVAENFITEDTEAISANADQAVKAATAQLANEAKKFDTLQLPPDVARKFKLLKLSVDIPAPHDPAAQRNSRRLPPHLMATTARAR